MCFACEQDDIWLAYLESQGLLKSDDPEAVEALFSAFPVQALPAQTEWDSPTPEAPAKNAPAKNAAAKNAANRAATAPATTNPFSCDDPTDDPTAQ